MDVKKCIITFKILKTELIKTMWKLWKQLLKEYTSIR